MITPCRILLVQNDPAIADRLTRILWRLGMGDFLKVAEDGASALGFLSMEKFDLLILDLAVPLVKGPQLLGVLNRDSAFEGIRILVNSPVDARYVRQRISGPRLARIGFLEHPFDLEDFRQCIRDLFDAESADTASMT